MWGKSDQENLQSTMHKVRKTALELAHQLAARPARAARPHLTARSLTRLSPSLSSLRVEFTSPPAAGGERREVQGGGRQEGEGEAEGGIQARSA